MMKKVKIITDSCSDLNKKTLEKNDIDYALMSTITNGKEAPAYLTWSAAEVHDFYESMRNGKRITTTQVPVEEFNRIFKKYLGMDYDIVYIACSSKQSGSVNTGRSCFCTVGIFRKSYEYKVYHNFRRKRFTGGL